MDFTPNPIAFSVLGLGIRWYAVLICAGILLAGSIGLLRIPRRGITRNDYLDVILFSVPIGIIGARAWYVIFEWEQYHSVFDVINIRAGGLGIHGGLIAGFITAFIVCRVKHISFLDCIDTAVPCIALAQAIGRWGNFFNQEAYGTPTNLPWAIVIDGVHVHPTFLYESIWCLCLFVFLSIKDRRKTFRGQTLTLYMMLYSLERLLVEQLRTDSLLAGPEKLVLALKDAGLDPTQVDGAMHAGPILLYPFRTAQFVSLCAIVLALLLYLILKLVKVKAPQARFVDEEGYADFYDEEVYGEVVGAAPGVQDAGARPPAPEPDPAAPASATDSEPALGAVAAEELLDAVDSAPLPQDTIDISGVAAALAKADGSPAALAPTEVDEPAAAVREPVEEDDEPVYAALIFPGTKDRQ